MYKWLNDHKSAIRLTASYVITTTAVVLLVTFITLFVLGYRFNIGDRRIEQYAFLQFASSPSGAVVTVNGERLSSKTPTKLSMPAGTVSVLIDRDGYETWSKTINIKSGMITWLNYALLIPKDIALESVGTFDDVAGSLKMSDGRGIVIQQKANVPVFDMYNISSDSVEVSKITLPASLYSAAKTDEASTFNMMIFDQNDRHMLVKHVYGSNVEWIVVDTQDVKLSVNISRLFGIQISDIKFIDGNEYYALVDNNIRKLNLSAGTISRPYINNVDSFEVYSTNVITYLGKDSLKRQIAGVYRDGDENATVVRTDISGDNLLRISTSRYFKQNYIAVSDGSDIDILSGSYPSGTTSIDDSMKLVSSFSVNGDISNLSFSPSGEYVVARTGNTLTSYDLEYGDVSSAVIGFEDLNADVSWLDDNYLWTNDNGKLNIFEFDGQNRHVLNPIAVSHGVALNYNSKYIYSIGKTSAGYQLQRVRLDI